MSDSQKNPHAVALGSRGGRKGGWKKWFTSLTPEQRRAHQQAAARVRWAKAKAVLPVPSAVPDTPEH